MASLNQTQVVKQDQRQYQDMDDFADSLNLVLPLSHIDQSVSRKYVRRMFIFDFPIVNKVTIDKATSAIRGGLEVALKHYPFLTGMLGCGDNPDRDTVVLRYGHTDELRQIREDIFKVRLHTDQLALDRYRDLCNAGMPTSCLRPEDFCATRTDWKLPRWVPAFALQVNFLKDGGLIICLEFQHSITDGTSIGLFLNVFTAGIRGESTAHNVGEYRGMDIDALFEDDIEKRLETLNPDTCLEWDFRNEVAPMREPIDSHILTTSAKTVTGLKSRINEHIRLHFHKDGWVSTTDCISALLLVYITRARYLSRTLGDSPRIVFTTAVNIRKLFKGDMEPTQFGNLFVTAAVPYLCKDMIPEHDNELELPGTTVADIASIAYKLRSTLEGIGKDHVLQRIALLSQLNHPTDASAAAARACHPAVTGVKFGSLVNFGADLDFGIPGTTGDGSPRFCRKPWMYDEGMVNILPRKGGTKGSADWEILLCLPASTIEIMLRSHEFGQYIKRFVHDKKPDDDDDDDDVKSIATSPEGSRPFPEVSSQNCPSQ